MVERIQRIDTDTDIDNLKKEELIDLVKSMDKKIKAQENFLINISHDLRSPVNVILSIIQCVKYLDKVKGDETKRMEYRDIIRRNGLKMMKLIDNLIDTTKLEGNYYKLNKKNVDIVSLIENTVASIAQYADQKRIQLVFDTNVEECKTTVDPQAIDRIMMNLLSNAIKFSPLEGKILVYVLVSNDIIKISVKDEGPGIDDKDQQLIFNRFAQSNQAKNSEQCGSGIGLDLVNYFAKLHNGQISVKSVTGQGSEFIVNIPIDESEAGGTNGEFIKKNKVDQLEVEFSDIYL